MNGMREHAKSIVFETINLAKTEVILILIKSERTIKALKESSIPFCLSSENVFYSMDKKIARVIWSRGKYSNVYRSTIVDPSPLKEGQKVSVLWGKTKKEFSAVIECYPVQPASREPSSQESLAPRKAKAKQRLVCIHFRSKTLTTLALRVNIFLGIDF